MGTSLETSHKPGGNLYQYTHPQGGATAKIGTLSIIMH